MIVDGISVVIVRKKVKRITLKITNSTPLISCPYTVSESYLQDFVRAKKGWITKQLEKEKSRLKITFCPNDGQVVQLLSHEFCVRVVKSENDAIKIQGNNLIFFEKNAKNREKNYKQWLKVQLEKVIEKLLERWQPRMQIKCNGFVIKKVKSKWGWCNTKNGVLGFNLMLLFQKKEGVEYVVVHELAHLFERGHNKRFYSIVSKFLPDYKTADKTLVMPIEN